MVIEPSEAQEHCLITQISGGSEFVPEPLLALSPGPSPGFGAMSPDPPHPQGSHVITRGSLTSSQGCLCPACFQHSPGFPGAVNPECPDCGGTLRLSLYLKTRRFSLWGDLPLPFQGWADLEVTCETFGISENKNRLSHSEVT